MNVLQPRAVERRFDFHGQQIGDDAANAGERLSCIYGHANRLRFGTLVAHRQEDQGSLAQFQRRIQFRSERDVAAAASKLFDGRFDRISTYA
ncbi:hypothetical protein ACI6PO_16320 [Agrobacterium tumefaciens]